MRKFILAFILFIILIVFIVFFYNTYALQKNYFSQKVITTPTAEASSPEIVEVPSRYINYSKEEYDKIISNKTMTVLFFTSNWCLECSKQTVINKSVFDELNKEGVVGLAIHILDSETTTETDALAKKFDVTKESTFVILDKTGAVAYKYTGEITSDMLKNKILDIIK